MATDDDDDDDGDGDGDDDDDDGVEEPIPTIMIGDGKLTPAINCLIMSVCDVLHDCKVDSVRKL